jgi:hypothetical protein
MNKELLKQKTELAFEILEEQVNIASDKNFFEKINTLQIQRKKSITPVKYLLAIILLITGLYSGIFLGTSINDNTRNSMNTAMQENSSKETYSLEKIILGKDNN